MFVHASVSSSSSNSVRDKNFSCVFLTNTKTRIKNSFKISTLYNKRIFFSPLGEHERKHRKHTRKTLICAVASITHFLVCLLAFHNAIYQTTNSYIQSTTSTLMLFVKNSPDSLPCRVRECENLYRWIYFLLTLFVL